MNEYSILIKGVEEGVHSFNFNIKDAFFKKFEKSEITKADIRAHVVLEKKNNRLTLFFNISGEINNLLCDICAESIPVSIQTKTKMLIQENSKFLNRDDEIIYVSKNNNKIILDSLLFELITVAIPATRRHKFKNGKRECDKEMLRLIEKYKNHSFPSTDPRWDALKEIKIKQ